MFEDVKHIFFDLDHTLWDFERNSGLTFQKIFQKYEVKVPLEDFLKTYRPINLAYWKMYRDNRIDKENLRYHRLKDTFDAMDRDISDEIICKLSEGYIDTLSSFGNLIPNAMSVLAYLAPKYSLHIITNGFREGQRKKMSNANIQHFFDEVIDSETAGVKKPHPKIFELALSRAKTLAENALMVGDNLEADIVGAKAVGMYAIHFNFHKEPEHQLCPIINNLEEIKRLL